MYLRSQNVELDAEYVKSFQLKYGKYVKVSIADTGIGMDEETKQRIFDPFFTTKEMGRGTGLGLASVYGIIQNHLGIIEVETEKGVGTAFHIYLPVSEETYTEEERECSEKLFIGEETVLLVDDEDPIIDVGREMLRKLGYKVLTANSGKEALDICERKKGEIDLVILDMIMPDMEGIKTHEKLKVIDPEIEVLFSSGYRTDQQETGITLQETYPFIQKPFNIRLLSQRIREVLKKTRESEKEIE